MAKIWLSSGFQTLKINKKKLKSQKFSTETTSDKFERAAMNEYPFKKPSPKKLAPNWQESIRPLNATISKEVALLNVTISKEVAP